MSKELEALKKLKDNLDYDTYYQYDNKECLLIIETALKDYEKRLALAKEYKDVNNVAKRLKALQIIKEKTVNVGDLKRCKGLEDFNDCWCYNEKEQLTQEEYDLLKEVLL